MSVSVFDLFSIGIGPSSSHTVGPMRAARSFARLLADTGVLEQVAEVRITLYGSLAATGAGHGTLDAVLLGLEGAEPETVAPYSRRAADRLALLRAHEAAVSVVQERRPLPAHPNALTCRAYAASGAELLDRTYYSVGGGFVVEEGAAPETRTVEVPFAFGSADELLSLCAATGRSIGDLMLANETAWRTEDEIRKGLLDIWAVMRACIDRGLDADGVLPGSLKVRRRAAGIARQLDPGADSGEWLPVYAMAVNEENAAGGRVVTAPTNGAAGIIPAVLRYYTDHVPGADDEGVVRFLLTAGAIGLLFKQNASISGAEVGCQGEVGSACAMAAAALTEVLGGTPAQVENAAEIGMEHNLGLTCDPVGGLVQIPCIERNGMAAVKAVTAARIALRGDGRHHVSLDTVIKTMKETGADMSHKYKETAQGGLAVNVVEC